MKDDQPSNTARLIARCTLLASRDPALSRLIPEDGVEPLAQLLAGDLFCKGLRFALFRRLLRFGERLLLPGIIAHYLARKAHIEQEVERAIAAGCRQVVVIGAGYETLAWRLHQKHPDVRFLEIDHPATQKLKRQRLDCDENLTFKALDLDRDLPVLKAGNGHTGSVFIIEGVTMYLTEDQVSSLLRTVASQAGANGKVIWTFMEKEEGCGPGFRGQSALIPTWLKFRNEPFRWGLARNQVKGFSSNCQLQVNQIVDHQVMRAQIMDPLGLQSCPLARGELICTPTPRPA